MMLSDLIPENESAVSNTVSNSKENHISSKENHTIERCVLGDITNNSIKTKDNESTTTTSKQRISLFDCLAFGGESLASTSSTSTTATRDVSKSTTVSSGSNTSSNNQHQRGRAQIKHTVREDSLDSIDRRNSSAHTGRRRSRSPRRLLRDKNGHLLTGMGNPANGDADICPGCGQYEDYASDGVYLCFQCVGDDFDDECPICGNKFDSNGNCWECEAYRCKDCGKGGLCEHETIEKKCFACSGICSKCLSKSCECGEQDELRNRSRNGSDCVGFCNKCDKYHDWGTDEFMSCVPPLNVLRFGNFRINQEYRQALYNYASFYDTEEVVGSMRGNNPNFPSEEEFLRRKHKNKSIFDDDDSDLD